jgi:hypothetical protein
MYTIRNPIPKPFHKPLRPANRAPIAAGTPSAIANATIPPTSHRFERAYPMTEHASANGTIISMMLANENCGRRIRCIERHFEKKKKLSVLTSKAKPSAQIVTTNMARRHQAVTCHIPRLPFTSAPIAAGTPIRITKLTLEALLLTAAKMHANGAIIHMMLASENRKWLFPRMELHAEKNKTLTTKMNNNDNKAQEIRNAAMSTYIANVTRSTAHMPFQPPKNAPKVAGKANNSIITAIRYSKVGRSESVPELMKRNPANMQANGNIINKMFANENWNLSCSDISVAHLHP